MTQKLWMLAAIFTLCGATMTFSSCDDDDNAHFDNEKENTTDLTADKAEVTYYVKLGANTLELADVEVTYLDENKESKSIMMTENVWTLKRTLTASDMPADFSLKVSFEQKNDITPDKDKNYEFGCISRIPFKVYNSKGKKICDHQGAIAYSEDESIPVLTGEQMSGWWISYELGINPDKLLNFDKKTLTIKSDRAVFNKMDYKYPYLND